jgi:hypothetical protein
MRDATIGLELELDMEKELSRLGLSLLAGCVQQLVEDRHQQLANGVTAVHVHAR